MADEHQSKVVSNSFGAFWITTATSHTVAIDEDGLSNFISIERLIAGSKAQKPSHGWAVVRSGKQLQLSPSSAPVATLNKTHPETKHSPPTHEGAKNVDMYVFDHIVAHINTKDSNR